MRLLEQHDCDVWLDYFDIKPTEILNEELSDNLEQAEGSWTACSTTYPSAMQYP
jgi:hypothetical protein